MSTPACAKRVAKVCRRSCHLKSLIPTFLITRWKESLRLPSGIFLPFLLKKTRSFLILFTFDLLLSTSNAILLSGSVLGLPFLVFWIRIVLRNWFSLCSVCLYLLSDWSVRTFLISTFDLFGYSYAKYNRWYNRRHGLFPITFTINSSPFCFILPISGLYYAGQSGNEVGALLCPFGL